MQGGEAMIYVGIDWADDHHDVLITDDSAKTLTQFKFSHDSDGFNKFHDSIITLEKEPSKVLVAIETNRGLLVHELLRSGYLLYSINPKAVNRFKDRHTLSNAKSDPLDAMALAHLLRTDRQRFKALKPLPDDYRLLDRLCNDLRKLVDEKSRIITQIISVLKEFYPKALKLISIDSNIAVAFLKEFPDSQSLSRCNKKGFLSLFKKHHYTRPDNVEKLWETAQVPTPQPDNVIAKACRFRLLSLLAQLSPLREHIAQYEKEIQAILESLPDTESISSMPGAGKRLTPELVALLGPKTDDSQKRFNSAEDITKLAGCVPVSRQSGKWRTVSVRYSCVKPLRRTFYDWAFTSLKESAWARAYYDYYKQRNQGHSTIMRNLGKKWAKILFAIWSQGLIYDESLHIKNLKTNNVPWAMAL